jgi:hypothetical protein
MNRTKEPENRSFLWQTQMESTDKQADRNEQKCSSDTNSNSTMVDPCLEPTPSRTNLISTTLMDNQQKPFNQTKANLSKQTSSKHNSK